MSGQHEISRLPTPNFETSLALESPRLAVDVAARVARAEHRRRAAVRVTAGV